MRKTLKPTGVLVINTFGDFEPGEDFFTGADARAGSHVQFYHRRFACAKGHHQFCR